MMCTGFAGYGCADAAGRGGCATAVAIASNTDPMVPRRYRCPRGLLVEGILRRSRMDIARGVRHRQFNVRFPAILILLGNGCKWPKAPVDAPGLNDRCRSGADRRSFRGCDREGSRPCGNVKST